MEIVKNKKTQPVIKNGSMRKERDWVYALIVSEYYIISEKQNKKKNSLILWIAIKIIKKEIKSTKDFTYIYNSVGI